MWQLVNCEFQPTLQRVNFNQNPEDCNVLLISAIKLNVITFVVDMVPATISTQIDEANYL